MVLVSSMYEQTFVALYEWTNRPFIVLAVSTSRKRRYRHQHQRDCPPQTLATLILHLSPSFSSEDWRAWAKCPQTRYRGTRWSSRAFDNAFSMSRLGESLSEIISCNMLQGVARNLIVAPASSFSGSLSVSETLHIKSLASPINANITLVQSGHPFNVQFDTGHALVLFGDAYRMPNQVDFFPRPIHALVRIENLRSTGNPRKNPTPVQCNITASTVNAPIRLEVAYNSPHVVLHVDASTKLAPLFMRVPPAYEGKYAHK
jgi:hypothetical protein